MCVIENRDGLKYVRSLFKSMVSGCCHPLNLHLVIFRIVFDSRRNGASVWDSNEAE